MAIEKCVTVSYSLAMQPVLAFVGGLEFDLLPAPLADIDTMVCWPDKQPGDFDRLKLVDFVGKNHNICWEVTKLSLGLNNSQKNKHHLNSFEICYNIHLIFISPILSQKKGSWPAVSRCQEAWIWASCGPSSARAAWCSSRGPYAWWIASAATLTSPRTTSMGPMKPIGTPQEKDYHAESRTSFS